MIGLEGGGWGVGKKKCLLRIRMQPIHDAIPPSEVRIHMIHNALGRVVGENLGAALVRGRGGVGWGGVWCVGGGYQLKVDELTLFFYTELEVQPD